VSSSHTEVDPAGPGREAEEPDGVVSVTMPQMGISVSEGTILEWRKQAGDAVEADETICDVTTDKVDVEIPCPVSGVVERVLVEPGETVAVGTVIAEVGSGASVPAENRNGSGTPAAAPTTPDVPAAPAAGDRSGFVSPVVRRMAAEHGVDLAVVEGHGVGGRIRKKDLLAHIEGAGSATPKPRPLHTESPYRPDEPAAPEPAVSANGHAPVAGERREPMTPMRRAIAEHMVMSRRTAAHCTTIVEVDFAAVAARRAELKPAFERKGLPLTYLAFVARATVEALEEFPIVNASVDGDEIVHHDSVNLGIAVALAGEAGGLIVPVVRDAQRLSLEGMAAAIADVATKARERRLEPDDVQGGTFTITNPGQFGAVLATPIINQPQVAILDLEAIVKRPVVVDGPDGSDAIAIRPMAYLPMSWDHRALDGAEAARFLSRIKERLESGEVR
jgi:2-oxoglutarate dehydrogenase complex dihydrolipoamide succinyltransferase (E2) component